MKIFQIRSHREELVQNNILNYNIFHNPILQITNTNSVSDTRGGIFLQKIVLSKGGLKY